MANYIQIGKIVNTHGIKGDLKVIPLTNDKARYEVLHDVFIEGENEKFIIEKVWYKKDSVMVKLKGYDNINDVIKFKDRFLLIEEKDAIDLPADTFFIFQIIGLKVYTVDNKAIGEVVDVLQPGANDVYVISNNGKELLIPAIKEVVKKVDLEENKLIIDPIEGMI